jgi:carboxymethylenebutenolidase
MSVTASRVFDLRAQGGTMPVKVFEPNDLLGGVIIYMDAFGWRPELDALCRIYAEAGFKTFLPDLFWRQGTLRFSPPPSSDEPLDPAMIAANLATTMAMSVADTGVILSKFAGSGAGRCRLFGTVGYCMGARHALAAAVSYPDVIHYVACLHGGRMVSDEPSSPHLLIPRVKGRVYLGFAEDDDTCPDEDQKLLRETLAQSGVRGDAELFAAKHGWTFPDRWCHDPEAAAAVHAKVLGHLKEELAQRESMPS